ncbi:MAG TPA: D-aminoacyl-tRNA deacylase [Candidatus Kapabacteria bacterium]|nr:D-aminoacyl-tRNA deacylase [Candidatus Kapabacteria bacterium]
MRLLIQRVSQAKVTVAGETTGEIGRGLLVFLGVASDDTEVICDEYAGKITRLRIFEDDDAKMNLDINEVHGSILIVSQFTLYGDTRKGNRPSFTAAAKAEPAERLYRRFIAKLQELLGIDRVREGRFGAMMDVELTNDGPVTIWIDNCL